MSIPAHPVDIPDRVRALVPGMDLSVVWLNDAGGVTFRGAGEDDVVFVKLQPRGGETSEAAEIDRLRWASSFTAVPEVRSWGGDATHEWLVTTGMAGESAVSERGTRAHDGRSARSARGSGNGMSGCRWMHAPSRGRCPRESERHGRGGSGCPRRCTMRRPWTVWSSVTVERDVREGACRGVIRPHGTRGIH